MYLSYTKTGYMFKDHALLCHSCFIFHGPFGMLNCLVNIIIMNLGQNVCLDDLWVGFSKCYDTQLSITGPSWLSCFVFQCGLLVPDWMK